MSKLYDILSSLADRFHGCSSDRVMYLTLGTSVTPSRDGWLAIGATASASTGAAPVIRIQEGSNILGEAIGMASSGSLFMAYAPVKKGRMYTINVYRCALASEALYY